MNMQITKNISSVYESQSFFSKLDNESNNAYDEEIDVVLHLEKTAYKCRNYIEEYKPSINLDCRLEKLEKLEGEMIGVWRDHICIWSHEVVDCYEINREIVAISMSLFDRFLSKLIIDSDDHVTKHLIECAAVTSLYMSIKINASNEPFPADSFFDSAGFTRDEVFDMEKTILFFLKWRVNPPTTEAVRNLLFKYLDFPQDLFPIIYVSEIKEKIEECSRFLCELSVCDKFFISKRPSVIAFSSILCSIEFAIDFYMSPPSPSTIGCNNDYQRSILHANRAKFLEVMKDILPLDDSSFLEEIDLCRNRLHRTYQEGCYGHAFPLIYSPPVVAEIKSCYKKNKTSLHKMQNMSPSCCVNFFNEAIEIDPRQGLDDDISVDDTLHTQSTNGHVVRCNSFDENEFQISRKRPRYHENACI
eukprot:CAMPEP_0194356510 /NCGR_PEP_ID=MMETSP0174-20130528/4139_1 /TAXON_ID=216777 /ORGANISM="Proboscia alata, Strain PI-D3" /LENGTH=416 /DNA_ID=CAMNT_0039126127 /DNA_START=94 /DNA_END=1344 /DNA_ORIENTATION=-